VQELSNALWAISVLGITSEEISRPLAQAVSDRHRSFTRLELAQQCLQSHYAGNTLSTEALAHFQKILSDNPRPASANVASHQQQSIAKAISRFGFMPSTDVPLYNGLLTSDILFEIQSEGRVLRVAVEYDGPDRFLRPSYDGNKTASSSSGGTRVGPLDAKTRLRNALIRKLPDIFALITIPFYEWGQNEFDVGKENEFIRTQLENTNVFQKSTVTT
jgi:hypothetical protein